MNFEEMTVEGLRSYLRTPEGKDLANEHGITGVQIVRMTRDELLAVVRNGDGAPATFTVHEKKSNGNGNLASVIADAIKDLLPVPENTLDEERVREIAKEEMGTVKPIKIQVNAGTVKDCGVQHRIFPDLVKLAAMRLDIMLVGPSGSGKTCAVENIAKALDLPFSMTSVGLQTSKSDLLGYMSATGSYVSTHLRTAYEQGGVFLLDEVDAGNANVLTVINAMLSNGIAAFPDAMVKRHENFVFFCAANTYGRGADRQYVGRNALDGATLDRFVVVDFDYDETLEMAISSDSKWTKHVIAIRKAVFDLKEKVIVSPRASIRGGALIANGFDWNFCEDSLIWKGINPEVKNRVKGRVNE